MTPLQRPKQWADKTQLTDAEIADLQMFAAQIVENDGDSQFGDGFILAVLDRIASPQSYDPGTGNSRGQRRKRRHIVHTTMSPPWSVGPAS